MISALKNGMNGRLGVNAKNHVMRQENIEIDRVPALAKSVCVSMQSIINAKKNGVLVKI